MPIYEYECQSCGKQFEAIRSMSDPTSPLCPECGNEQTRKLVSRSSFLLKGTGWYVTDYANKSSSGTGKGADSANSSGGSDATKSTSGESSDSGSSKAPESSGAASSSGTSSDPA